MFCFASATQLLAIGLLAAAASSVSAAEDPNPHFASMWDEDLSETNNEPLVLTSGAVPSWLRGGSLVRNGPAQFFSAHRNFTWAFDGMARLCSWSFPSDSAAGEAGQGSPPALFSSAFVRSATFNKTRKDDKFPKMMTVGSVVPKYSIMDGVIPLHDNVNVNVWKFTDDAKSAMTVTDSVDTLNFDPATLATQGVQDWSHDTLSKTEISCAHPHIEPGTNGTSLINFALAVNPVGNVTIQVRCVVLCVVCCVRVCRKPVNASGFGIKSYT